MRQVQINTEIPYQVIIGAGLLEQIGDLLKRIDEADTIAIVTDSNVGSLYAERVLKAISGKNVFINTIPAGESNKNPENLLNILHSFAKHGMTRSDLVLALGGGVVGDIAGFAAAVYQRGIRFVQCPTSLLSAVDASVGGKTAIDLPEGKNLIGAFNQPSMVICDTDTFNTLPHEHVSDGAAEMIKHAVIADSSLFETMMTCAWKEDIENTLARNVEIKSSYVIGDENDQGKRQILNFGHTIGHALEAWSHYSFSHGQAVAIGMVMETRAARRMGLSELHEDRIIEALSMNALPTKTEITAEEIFDYAVHDKKRHGNAITVTIPVMIGEARLYKLDMHGFTHYIEAGIP